MPSYKSYCWSLGTTSFRRKELNKEIETQLKFLKEFWLLDENKGKIWNKNIQIDYYDFLREKGFLVGNAPNKDKDAREKTSGLVSLGLISQNRQLTSVGETLLKIIELENFNNDNLLRISNDSFIYFKQLLKTIYSNNDDTVVRPFIAIIDVLCEFITLNYSEFSLLSLITSKEKKDFIVESIQKMRRHEIAYDDIVWQIISSMDNYQEARSIFLNNTVTEDIIMQIGMNRDGIKHDKPYFRLYKELENIRKHVDDENILKLFDSIQSISKGCKPYWIKMLFNGERLTRNKIIKNGIECLNLNNPLLTVNTTEDFKEEFFKNMHLIKAKNLLDNYADLNIRVLKTTNLFNMVDDEIKFDIFPHCYFNVISNKLMSLFDKKVQNLYEDVSLIDISPVFNVNDNDIIKCAQKIYDKDIHSISEIISYIDEDRYNRFNLMIDNKFTNENLLQLLYLFENRNNENDSIIQTMVSNNADIPTIFEYVLGVIWYNISDRQGKVLEYMNLSLDADLLPITHASGGHEDITYKYEATDNYPKHTLLIEATLANGTNQRRMEMEPVSRHLGEYLLNDKNENAYCVFATTYLHINVISDFRNRITYQYYSNDGEDVVNGMKIIPLQTTELKVLIQNNIHYTQLYSIFEQAFNSNTPPNHWYQEEIKNILNNI